MVDFGHGCGLIKRKLCCRLRRRLRCLHLPHRSELLLLLHPLRVRHAQQAPADPRIRDPLGPLPARTVRRSTHHNSDTVFTARSLLLRVADGDKPEHPGHELLRFGVRWGRDFQHAVLVRVQETSLHGSGLGDHEQRRAGDFVGFLRIHVLDEGGTLDRLCGGKKKSASRRLYIVRVRWAYCQPAFSPMSLCIS